jgi:hypothetical protein
MTRGLMKKALLALAFVMMTAPAVSAVEVVGAGDIATYGSGDTKTSNLVVALDPVQVLTFGDNAYPDSTLAQFQNYYDPTWGRFKSKTLPAPGNHEWDTAGAAGYESYFNKPAGQLVAYEGIVAGWDIYQLDSEVNRAAQETALRNLLSSNPDACEIVYWHHPRFSSGEHGSSTAVQGLWDASLDHNVELVLNGHDHNYERFNAISGTREVVVGTGGVGTGSFDTVANGSVKRLTGNSNWGVLDLELLSGKYTAQFRAATGGTGTVRDSFSGSCQR